MNPSNWKEEHVRLATRRARPRRAIDPRRPRRRCDANSTTDARDATQVVFAVLGGWAVVIAGARSALS
jgi:hypothetical protein